ncbi:hypothetical protein Tco_1430614 [Tanacetum coccineum]
MVTATLQECIFVLKESKVGGKQMYLIAWEVVKVENNLNWCWFLSLLQEDMQLDHETALIIISYSHKCTRHVFATFKWKFSGVHLQRLFWSAASTIVEQHFYNKMEQIKSIHLEAHDYLVQRNPNSCCIAFFDLNLKCPSFENGIAESFNRAILVQRTKPIIIILKDIRLYIMQRLVDMNNKSINLEDKITPLSKRD